MPWNLLPTEDDGPSLWQDLWRGRLTTFGRIALSVAGLGAALMAGLIVIGLISQSGRIAEEMVALILVVSALVWLLWLSYLWFGHAVLGPVLRGLFALGAIWFVAILLAVIAASQLRRNEEIWVFACIVGGCTATALLGASIVYRRMHGRAIVTVEGQVNVNCPECGYSLVGKTDCTCPECGRQYTLDQLITLQDYDALRGRDPETPALLPRQNRPLIDGAEPRAASAE